MNDGLKRGLNYLKDRATEAHRSGDAGTVRHLSFIALHEAIRKQAGSPVSIDDISWAITYAIYWMRRPEEIEHTIKPAYDQVKKNISSRSVIYDFLFDVLESERKHLEQHRKTLHDLRPAEVISEGADLTPDGLLLSLVIEVGWWLDRASGWWDMLAQKWSHELGNSPLGVSLATTLNRLRRLDDVLFGQSRVVFEMPSLSGTSALLANCWDLFYAAEFHRLKETIPELAQAAPFSSEYFFAAQGLITMTCMSVGDFSAANSWPRVDRARMSRPAAVVQSLRFSAFDELLGKARQQRGAGHIRLELFRLALVMKLAALRTWNLGEYLDVLRRERELYLHIGCYQWENTGRVGSHGHDLLQGVLLGICALSTPDDNQAEAIKLLEVCNDARQLLDEFATRLFNLKPIERRYAEKLLHTLGDAFPEERLPELADWTLALLGTYHNDVLGGVHFPVSFWAPIVEHCQIPEDIWPKIGDFVSRMANSPHQWLCHHQLLTAVLSRAPGPLTNSIAGKMMAVDVQDGTDEDYRRMILYNAALQNRDLRGLVQAYLTAQSEKYPTDIAIRVDHDRLQAVEFETLETMATAANRLHLVDQFVSWCEQLRPAERGVWSMQDYPLSREFRRMPWDDAPEELTNKVLRASARSLRIPGLAEEDGIAILQALFGLANHSTPSVRRQISDLVFQLIQDPPKTHNFEDAVPLQEGPFATFSIWNRPEFVHELVAVAALVFPFAQQDHKSTIVTWSITRALDTSDSDAAHLARLFFYSLLNPEQASTGQIGIAVMAGQRRSPEIASRILTAIRVVISEAGNQVQDQNARMQVLFNSPVALTALERWIDTCVNAPEPSARHSLAKMLHSVPTIVQFVPKAEEIIERLKVDARASIRVVWQTGLTS